MNTTNLEMNEIAIIRDKGKVKVIGLVDNLNPLSVQLRWYHYSSETHHYDNTLYNDWEKTGIYATESEWHIISCDKGVKEICELINIPYILRNNEELLTTENYDNLEQEELC